MLLSQPTGYNPVGKPSTGCGAQRQKYNANAGITGREAHQNDESNSNATLNYSTTRDDPKAYTDIPVAYLLNIWILGPVAPLTGQYSCGGLN